MTTPPTPPPPPDPTPYDLEPPTPPAPKEGLLSGFDKNADFTKDPEVETALKGPRAKSSPPAEREPDEKPLEPFVKPFLGGAQVWGIVGGFILVGAVVAAAMTAEKKFAMSLLVLYSGLLHAFTGVVAVFLTARLESRRMGEIELAAGRMLTAVAAFLVIFNLRIELVGHTKVEELILATLAYVGVLAGLFRIWGRTLLTLAALHFLLWITIELGMQLSTWAAPVATAAQGTTR